MLHRRSNFNCKYCMEKCNVVVLNCNIVQVIGVELFVTFSALEHTLNEQTKVNEWAQWNQTKGGCVKLRYALQDCSLSEVCHLCDPDQRIRWRQ